MSDHLFARADVGASCCIKGCDDKADSMGLCLNHMRRNQKYGSPVASKNYAPFRWKRMSHEDRFWHRVLKIDDEDSCWLWQGGVDTDGYGLFNGMVDGVLYRRAHRFSLALHKGIIPPGLSACHTCDTPACVRDSHLFSGTTLDNQTDKWAKGRGRVRFGEQHVFAALTEEQAQAILQDPRPHVAIAREYNVAPSTIGSLKQRVSWSHLGNEKGVKAPRISPRLGKSDKVTSEIVRIIRASSERGVDLAKRFGIKPQDICDIRKRRSWAHIEETP